MCSTELSIKSCSRCKEEKPLSDFCRSNRIKSGRTAHCKECDVAYRKSWISKNEAKYKDQQHQYYLKNKHTVRMRSKIAHYKKAYGMTLDEVESLLKSQQGTCKICGNVLGEFHVDHCHLTGRVRGILCPFCNKGLGHFMDKKENLESALAYLAEFEKYEDEIEQERERFERATN